MFLKTFDSELPYFEVWITDQNYNLVDIEDKAHITLCIN